MENVYCKGSEVMQQKTDFCFLNKNHSTLRYDLGDTEVDFQWTQSLDKMKERVTNFNYPNSSCIFVYEGELWA